MTHVVRALRICVTAILGMLTFSVIAFAPPWVLNYFFGDMGVYAWLGTLTLAVLLMIAWATADEPS